MEAWSVYVSTLFSSNPSILDDALVNECVNNHILGPFDSLPLPNLWCSGLGLVPKHDGGWRTRPQVIVLMILLILPHTP